MSRIKIWILVALMDLCCMFWCLIWFRKEHTNYNIPSKHLHCLRYTKRTKNDQILPESSAPNVKNLSFWMNFDAKMRKSWVWNIFKISFFGFRALWNYSLIGKRKSGHKWYSEVPRAHFWHMVRALESDEIWSFPFFLHISETIWRL